MLNRLRPTEGIFAVLPGTTPASDLRAMSARTALSHFIDSSSLGAHNTSVRFVVTILNVCFETTPVPPWLLLGFGGCG
jgi:hypothetical protein